MGQAKQRGTFEQRKAAAIERNEELRRASAEIQQINESVQAGMEIQRRKQSPKHAALMAMIAGLAVALAPTDQQGEKG